VSGWLKPLAASPADTLKLSRRCGPVCRVRGAGSAVASAAAWPAPTDCAGRLSVRASAAAEVYAAH